MTDLQKPVAWGVFEGNLHDVFFTEAEAVEMAQLKGTHAEVKPLYTHPQACEPEPPAQEWDLQDKDPDLYEPAYRAVKTFHEGKPVYVAEQPAQEPVGDEWTPCMKLPVVVHVRKQRPGESHVSTREGITPVKPDDLIMRGVSGEEYPIGRAIFEQTYSLDTTPQPPAQREDWGPGPHEYHSLPAQKPEFFTHCVDKPYDWSEWVCPDPKGYLMKCCDCGLVHEAQFSVVRYASEAERENCETVDDPNLQAVFRMRRSEQWSPADTAHRAGGLSMKQPAQQEPVARLHISETDTYPDIEVEVLNGATLQPSMSPVNVYTRPQAREPLTDEEIADYLGDEYHSMTEEELRFFRLGEQAAHGITGGKK